MSELANLTWSNLRLLEREFLEIIAREKDRLVVDALEPDTEGWDRRVVARAGRIDGAQVFLSRVRSQLRRLEKEGLHGPE